ncbi:phage tail tape measure protein [Leuconostoc gelidum subsp. gasicomitatum]|uniref:phage tail tape measure protein n=1 Tax=Leuconostoc gasicomitatum TaxID=115778 RepID=UPI001CC79262|nr:phage tail tape measure protein [Leuconostoc gasicomitatum]MBZ5984993.1 phage tail tape measure protein [Leuconostoc gasicomitatum]
MAGSRIKGITIEINGDTKGLDKALGNVNQSASKTQQELRDVNKLLKLDPGNTELIAQKQKLLGQAIEQTGNKLKTLKAAQAQVEAQFKSGDIGEEQYRAFQREVASTEATLKGYKSQLSTAQSSQQELGQSTQRLQNYFKATGTSIDDFKSLLGTRLVSAIKNGTASAESMDKALQMIARESGVASSDMRQLNTVLDSVDDSNIKKAASSIKDLGAKSEDSSGKMSVFKGAVMAEGLSKVSEKAAEAGGAVIETAMEFSNAQSTMSSAMGLTSGDAKKATDIVKEVFGTGMVESVGDANEAVKDVINSFGYISDMDGMKKISLDLVAISKHANVDVKDAANASSQAMKAMGLSGSEATDLIAKGLQDGLDKNDDFLDTVNEYAPTFQDAGISAGGMLSILNEGMAAGAFNTDKVADAVKEFQLRLTSGQLDEPLQKFSQATKGVFDEFKNGKATSAEVMTSVGKDLSTMPANEAKGAVQGLGTQFEDLGQQASSALLSVATQTEDTTGATKKMSEQTPGEKWVSALNTLKMAFSDVVIQMTPLLNKLSDLVKWFNNLSPTVKTVVAVFGAISAVIATLAPVITMIVGIIGAFGAGALLPLIGIITAVIAVITGIVLAVKNWGAIVKWLQGAWSVVVDFFSGIWYSISQTFINVINTITTYVSLKFNEIKTIISNIVTDIANTISTVWNGIVSVVSTVFNAIKSVIETIWNGIKIFFTVTFAILQALFISAFNILSVPIRLAFEVIKAIIIVAMQVIKAFLEPILNFFSQLFTTVFNTIKNFLSIVWQGITTVFTVALQFISTYIQNVIQGWVNIITPIMNVIQSVFTVIWNAISSTVSAVLNVILSIINTVWNGIVSVTTSVFNVVSSVVSSVWNGIKSIVSSVVNAIMSTISSIWNNVKSITVSVFNAISSTASSVWNSIKNVISNVVNGIKNTVNSVWNGIKSLTSSVWNGIKSAMTGPIEAARDVISGIVDRIKSLFSFKLHFPEISIPHISLPHFSLEGSFNPLKGQIPHVGVNWYAKGGIFNKPAMFAAPGGFNGVGEAGPETALPLNAKTLGGIGRGIAEATGGLGGDNFTINIYPTNDMSYDGVQNMARQMVEAIKGNVLLKKDIAQTVGNTLGRGVN